VNPAHWPGGLAYLAIFIAAVVEGEVVFVTASVLVGRGELNALGVLLAGALGGSAGDQFFFYVLRGRLHRWLDRFPRIARRHRAITERVVSHSTAIVLASRFLPGLRTAIPAACAYAGVAPMKFSSLSLVSSLFWASTILCTVAWGGPKALSWVGLGGWWGVVLPAVLILAFFRWLSRSTARLDSDNGADPPADPGVPVTPRRPSDTSD
jgi:membrane protein DedA with SNARE-associated domain